MEVITKMLLENREEKYAAFLQKILPGVAQQTIIGVRTPLLRKMAKQISREEWCDAFLKECPHIYFEENQLHGFILSGYPDFEECIEKIEQFLPYIDNWATCDQTSPKVFKKHKELLLPYLRKWIQSDHVYTIRFAVDMLMQHFLDEDFRPEYLELVAGISSGEYYVKMAVAWYMATALAKQWDSAVPYIERGRMNDWVHNKTIQKAKESYRITREQKQYLGQFKKKSGAADPGKQ
jgi:3-methyladenine DNA glycosylase AlkD